MTKHNISMKRKEEIVKEISSQLNKRKNIVYFLYFWLIHIISRNGYRAPEDYADTFTVLGEKGAFEKSFINDKFKFED